MVGVATKEHLRRGWARAPYRPLPDTLVIYTCRRCPNQCLIWEWASARWGGAVFAGMHEPCDSSSGGPYATLRPSGGCMWRSLLHQRITEATPEGADGRGGRLCVVTQAGGYRGHRTEMRLCVHNAKSKVMVSGDERCLRLWRPFSGKEVGGCVSQSMYTWCTRRTPYLTVSNRGRSGGKRPRERERERERVVVFPTHASWPNPHTSPRTGALAS